MRGTARIRGRAWRVALALMLCVALTPTAWAGPRPVSRAALPGGSTAGSSGEASYAEGELLVRFRRGLPAFLADYDNRAVGAKRLERFTIVPDLELVELPPGMTVEQGVALYSRRPNVVNVTPNYIYRSLDTTPNDPQFGEQWGLHNSGQSGGTVDADIDAPFGWDQTTGSRDVIVAVLDTGVNYLHEDLGANILFNFNDSPWDEWDQDGNGYMDDYYGWDAVDNDGDPMDEDSESSHGTHVAGIIGAVGNNMTGVTGVNWQTSILAVRVLNSAGSGYAADLVEGLQYAKARGAQVINMSLGSPTFTLDVKQAIQNSGALACCAAGNDGTNNDTKPQYPASYNLDNILSVAATDRNDALASYSNFGTSTVDVAAPGSAIRSTVSSHSVVATEWAISAVDWNLVPSVGQSWEATDSALEMLAYAPNVSAWATRTASFDLGSVSNSVLGVWSAHNLAVNDEVRVYASSTGSFTESDTVGAIRGVETTDHEQQFDVSHLAGGELYVGLRFVSDATTSAPGVVITGLSVYGGTNDSDYGDLSGTSMATPFAAGLAAALLAEKPTMTPQEVRTLIMDTVDVLPGLATKVGTSGRISFQGAREELGDVEPPVTTIIGVDPGWVPVGPSVTMTATDDISGVIRTWYRIDGGTLAEYVDPISISKEGSTTIDFYSEDASGNIEATRTATVRVDSTPPTTTADAQASYSELAVVNLAATDALSGVDGTWYRLDGGALTEDTFVMTSDEGVHTLEFYSRDVAGNTETTRSVSFEVLAPSTVPTGSPVIIPLPYDGEARIETVTVSGDMYVSRPNPGHDPPEGYRWVRDGYYEIHTDIVFEGAVQITLPYDGLDVDVSLEPEIRAFHWDGGWEDVTLSVDPPTDFVTFSTESFSDFGIAVPMGGPVIPMSMPQGVPLAALALLGLALAGSGTRRRRGGKGCSGN